MSKPSKRYAALFAKDGLLIEPTSRTEYGELILANLLTYRIGMIFKPTPVNLFLKKSLADTDRIPNLPNSTPPEASIANYMAAFHARSVVADADFDALSPFTIVSRPNKTCFRRPPLPSDLPDMQGPRLPEHKDFPDDDRLRIAAIGHRVLVSLFDGMGFLDEDLCILPKQTGGGISVQKPFAYSEMEGINRLGRTLISDPSIAPAWLKGVTDKIATALRRRSHIVVLPEFALPPDIGGNSVAAAVTATCANFDAEVGGSHGYFLFAGSRHEGPYNRGLILTRQPRGGDYETSEPLWHYKIASAQSQRENVLGPGFDRLLSYNLFIELPAAATSDKPSAQRKAFFTVFVPICYDAFDPAVFMALASESRSSALRTPTIILVPSFNRSSEFVALLRDLSFLGRCTVVYVNSLNGDSHLFVCGIDLADLHSNTTWEKIVAQLTPFSAELEKAFSEITDPMQDRLRSAPKDATKSLLEILRSDDFSSMVTVERCTQCEASSPQPHRYSCNRDILYYNIDLKLLRALADYRQFVLADESFLAPPLRAQGLTASKRGS